MLPNLQKGDEFDVAFTTEEKKTTPPVKVSVPEGTTGKVTLKAIAIKDGMQTSDVTTAVYTIQKAWSIVKGTVHPTENRYVTSATTDKAKQNLNFTQTEKRKKLLGMLSIS